MESKLKRRSEYCRGLKSCWLEGGETQGPIMLFLHGYPDSPETFEYQFDAFKDRYHIVAPYSRGCLPSEKSEELRRYGHASQCLDVCEILNIVDPTQKKPVIIIGHDVGAAHSWYLAGLIKKRLAAMVIVNGLSIHQLGRRFKDVSQQRKSWYIYAMLVPRLPKMILRRFSGQFLNYAYGKSKLSGSAKPDLKSSLGGVVNPSLQYKALVMDLIRGVGKSPVKLDRPVMLLWGKDDHFLERPQQFEIEKDASDVTIRLLRANHWVHREQPEHVNKLIDDFLVEIGGQ